MGQGVQLEADETTESQLGQSLRLLPSHSHVHLRLLPCGTVFVGCSHGSVGQEEYKLSKKDDTELAKTQVYSFFQVLLSVIIRVCYVLLVIVDIVFTSYLAGAYIVLPGLIGANVIAGVFIGHSWERLFVSPVMIDHSRSSSASSRESGGTSRISGEGEM